MLFDKLNYFIGPPGMKFQGFVIDLYIWVLVELVIIWLLTYFIGPPPGMKFQGFFIDLYII